jgi:dienelactone hydrolase
MPETRWTLKTADKHVIYGIKNSAKGKPKGAVFIVHGLTGHMNEYQLKSAADYFAAQGFDAFRFNLYDGEKGARRLVDCTIKTHADDLNTVLKKFAKAYKKTFAIGHSYGGTTVMMAQPKALTAASLWDPTFNLKRNQEMFDDSYKKLTGGFYSLDWGTTFLIGKAMHNHGFTLDEKACLAMAKNFNHPVQVIHAGDGFYIKDKLSYHSVGHPKNRHDVVKGTTHCFYEGNTTAELLKKTHAWFKQWM